MGPGADVGPLLAAARTAMACAYAPYSGYAVGAALESAEGEVFAGCNVESASSPAGICAERAALAAAVAAGRQRFRRIAIRCNEEQPAAPCGVCRQALIEFGDIEVVSEGSMGERRVWTLHELLPEAFALPPEHRSRSSRGSP
jgi:cytidine deaminase